MKSGKCAGSFLVIDTSLLSSTFAVAHARYFALRLEDEEEDTLAAAVSGTLSIESAMNADVRAMTKARVFGTLATLVCF